MTSKSIGWSLLAFLLAGAGAFAYLFWFAGGSGEPTTSLTTPQLAVSTTIASSEVSTTTAVGGAQTFVIDQSRSKARFEIDEELRGQPTHVVGATDQVVGQISLDLDDVSTVVFSDFVVNARTLTTDSERRDRAMRGPVILDSASDEFELITFSIETVEGLDGSATVGDSFDITLTGDLEIRGIARPVTFSATVNLVDESTIEGTAVAEVTREEFGIGIPNVPGVANVTNEVLIAFDFVAVAG